MSERKADFYKALVGKRQGNLLIRRVDHIEPKIGRIWECLCDCGNVDYFPTSRISYGGATMCRECATKVLHVEKRARLTKHGLSRTHLFTVWKSIHSRCYCKGDSDYSHYGERGISRTKEWESFTAFYEWALANGYKDGLTLDRINGNEGYTPTNCRWVSQKVQTINRDVVPLVTVNGVTMCMVDWSRAIGVARQTVYKWNRQGIIQQKIKKRFPKAIGGETFLIRGIDVTVL